MIGEVAAGRLGRSHQLSAQRVENPSGAFVISWPKVRINFKRILVPVPGRPNVYWRVCCNFHSGKDLCWGWLNCCWHPPKSGEGTHFEARDSKGTHDPRATPTSA